MIKRTTPFEIPNEMRAVLERSVEQAKLAFNSYIQTAQEAVSHRDGAALRTNACCAGRIRGSRTTRFHAAVCDRKTTGASDELTAGRLPRERAPGPAVHELSFVLL